MAKIYVIEGTEEVLEKIQETIPIIRRGWTKLLKILNNFLIWITSWTLTIFFLYHAHIQS